METVTIEVKPELAHRWRAIAEREGRALEAVAAEAGTGTLESDGANPLRDALALREELEPIIRAGTHNGGATFDAAADVRAMREERFADSAT